jgi:hypothetical protein
MGRAANLPPPNNRAQTKMATDAASVISIALGLLSRKIIFILALGMCFGLWCWAMWAHSWIALAIAASFAVLVFLPVLFKENSRAQDG